MKKIFIHSLLSILFSTAIVYAADATPKKGRVNRAPSVESMKNNKKSEESLGWHDGWYDEMGNYQPYGVTTNINETDASPPKAADIKGSPFAECSNVVMIGQKDYNKNKAYWDAAISQCKNEGINIGVLPEHGFLSALINKVGSEKTTEDSSKFLQKVGDEVLKVAITNSEIIDNMLHCVQGETAKDWFAQKKANAKSDVEREFYNFDKCKSVIAQHKEVIKKAGSEFRIQRALARETRSFFTKITDAVTKELPGESPALLTPEEKAIVASTMKKNMEEDTQSVNTELNGFLTKYNELKNDPKCKTMIHCYAFPIWFNVWYSRSKGGVDKRESDKFINTMIKQKTAARFASHYDAFNQALGQAPVLAYLTKTNPEDKDLIEPLKSVLANSKAEIIKIGELKKSAADVAGFYYDESGNLIPVSNSKSDKVNNSLELMKYGPIVRKILKEDPNQCSTATSVANYISSLDTKNSAAVFVGMVGATVAAAYASPMLLGVAGVSGAALATGVGVGATGMFIASDYQNYANSKSRALSIADATSSEPIADVQNMFEDRSTLAFDLAVAATGIDLVGSGMGTKAAARIFKQKSAVDGLRKALQKKNIPANEVEKLLKELSSTDPKVISQAASRITKEMNLPERDLKLIKAASSRGFLTERNPEAMKQIISDINTEIKSVKEREDVANRVIEILDKSASSSADGKAILNDAYRNEALEVAYQGAKLGHSPEVIAGKIKEFDDPEALKGLASVYKKSRDLFTTDADIIKIVKNNGDEAGRDAAFTKALDQMRESSPELKSLSDDAWQVRRRELVSCGLKPGK